tara:strand:+ start:1433 stop:1627 length:195 start_codon:yes stop_codon:yes gene_type:complete
MKGMTHKAASKAMAMEGLTDRQAKALRDHSEHHGDKHMKMMIREMKAGSTFGEAHKKAMAEVGE